MPEREWTEGQDVILVGSYGWSRASAARDTIERLTKTQIITKRGQRFNRRNSREVGLEIGSTIYPAHDETARRILRETRLQQAVQAVIREATQFAKTPTEATAQALRQAVEYWEFTAAPATPTENP